MTDAYLDKHAEPEARLALELVEGARFRHTVVIPAFDEPISILDDVFARVRTLADTLVVIVVNAPEGADRQAAARTRELLRSLGRRQRRRQVNQRLSLGACDGFRGASLLLVDLCNGHRPAKGQGVGRARKAGADIAYALNLHGQLDSPWVHVTDADVTLPSSYLDAEPRSNDVSCALYPFTHGERALPYELRLRLYVLGLSGAGSPWAFHTLGSILKIDLAHYGKVRGFPKRAAGEDFYLLNKLAKSGFIEALASEPVLISDRLSSRVPFGTGPAVAAARDGDPLELASYDPRIFELMKPWLRELHVLWEERESVLARGLGDWLRDRGASEALLDALAAADADDVFRRLAPRCRRAEQLSRSIQTWFDAFKTMRTVHRIRASGYPDVTLRQALDAQLGRDWSRAGSLNELSRLIASLEPTGMPMGLGPR